MRERHLTEIQITVLLLLMIEFYSKDQGLNLAGEVIEVDRCGITLQETDALDSDLIVAFGLWSATLLGGLRVGILLLLDGKLVNTVALIWLVFLD